MTSKKKLRSLLGGTLFMVLMLSVHPTTVSASAVGSSTVMDQSVETEDQQSGIQSETQTQASQDSGAAVRASQNGWVKAGDSGWYFYENGQLKTGWLYRNGNWYWLDPDRNGRMAENSWFTYDNNLYYAKGDGAIYKNGFQEVDGNLYYFQSWGGIQRNVYLSISGKMYYVQENGIVARGIVRTMNGHGDLCAFDDTTGAQITQKGWLKKGTSYYWVREDGVLQTGWLLYDDNWYWFDDNGVMMTSGWKEINNNLYYFRSWGGIYKNGFQSIGGNEYYFQSWGGVYRNTFFTVKGKTYIAQNDGSIYHASQTGWVQLGDQTYWINQDGSVQTGWLKLEGKWYWLKADGTRAASEWITYDNNRYYFDGDGVMYTGMKEVDGARYYFHSWGGMYKNAFITYDNNLYYLGSDSKMAIGWQSIGGNTYYFRNWGGMITGKQVIDGKTYVFDEDGKLVQSPDGFEPSAQIGVRTVRNFLKNALLPLGNTLYIWGGGHTDAEAESYGVNAQWKQFFNTQNSTYNYSDHLYEYGKGLDCSGYVGWTAHQVTKEYATTTSTGMPAYFARKGWGTCVTGDTSQKFTPGDVVSKSGHVWIVIGQCSDGSVVVIHATPPYIQLGGTVSSTGSINSEAIELANEYMKMYYPVAYERYGVKVLDRSYLTGVNHFTWSSSILSDSEGYRRKKPAEILNDLFQ